MRPCGSAGAECHQSSGIQMLRSCSFVNFLELVLRHVLFRGVFVHESHLLLNWPKNTVHVGVGAGFKPALGAPQHRNGGQV